MKMLNVQLTRQWSGHAAGEIVTVEAPTAESMVRKNYGEIVKAAPPAKQPAAETADAGPAPEPAAETADARPKTSRGRKAGD